MGQPTTAADHLPSTCCTSFTAAVALERWRSCDEELLEVQLRDASKSGAGAIAVSWCPHGQGLVAGLARGPQARAAKLLLRGSGGLHDRNNDYQGHGRRGSL